jgi:hypothetical protein
LPQLITGSSRAAGEVRVATTGSGRYRGGGRTAGAAGEVRVSTAGSGRYTGSSRTA